MSGQELDPYKTLQVDPEARTAVFDAVEKFVKEGLMLEEGNDFYSLTDKGKAAAREIQIQNSSDKS